MKKKYSFEIIFKALIIMALSCFISPYLYGAAVEVYPESILFDCISESFANDALTIRNATGGTADLPEYDSFFNRNNSIAYINTGQTTREIQVAFKSDYEGIVHLIIKLTLTTSSGIETVSNLFIPNYNTEYSAYQPINLAGTLPNPNKVSKQTFTLKWDIYAIPICAPGYSSASKTTQTTHTYYTLLAAPQAPMAEPWVSVLDKACVWAGGQTSSSTVAEKVVQGLYINSGFKYDVVNGGPSRYSGKYDSSFNLHYMLSEIGGNDIIVNCYDMGKSVVIFANALGCNSSYALCEYFGYVNCIKPIGRDWTNNPLYKWNTEYPDPIFSSTPILGEDVMTERSYFQSHAFGLLDSIIYDACLKVDTDSNPDSNSNPSNPPHVESWAIGWDWGNYKSKVIDNYPYPPNGTADPVTYSFGVY